MSIKRKVYKKRKARQAIVKSAMKLKAKASRGGKK